MDPSELHLETLVPREDAMSDCITEDMTNLSLLTPLEFVLVDSAQVQSFFYRYYSREDAAILIKHVNDIAEYKQCFDNYFREIKAARVDRASGEVGRPYSVSAMAAPTAAMLFADFIVELSVRLIHHLDLQKERLSSLDPYFSDLKEALLSQNELIDKAMQLILAAKKEVEAPGQTFGLVPRENIILVQGHPHLKDGGRWVSADVQHPVVKYPGTPWAKFFKGTRPFFNMLNGDIHLDEVIGDDVNVDGPKVLRRVLNMFFLKQEIAEVCVWIPSTCNGEAHDVFIVGQHYGRCKTATYDSEFKSHTRVAVIVLNAL